MNCERGPFTRSVTSSQTNSNRQMHPAMLGRNARRRAGDDACHRCPIRTQMVSAMTMSVDRCVVSMTL